MLRVFFGHHKCASTYIKDVFIQATDILGMVPRQVYGLAAELPLDFNTRAEFKEALQKRTRILQAGDFKTLILTNAEMESLALLEGQRDYRGFHVVRDPRDIVVSAYFSHLYSHGAEEGSWWLEFRKQLSVAKTVEQGLLLELDFLQTFLNNMERWNYQNPKVFESRYEILTKDPLNEFSRIFNFLGIRTPVLGLPTLVSLYLDQKKAARDGQPMPYREIMPRIMLQRVLNRNSFQHRARGRSKGEEDARSHYRKGVSGDWRTHFTPTLKEEFKKRYNGLLLKLKYETNPDW